MMYAQGRGIFYVQLEDDVITKPNFVAIMREFALNKNFAQPWYVIDFSQFGFIGKMFSISNLPSFIQFLLSFYNDKPGDWLLDDFIRTKVCRLDHDAQKCQEAKKAIRIQYQPSLFQVSCISSHIKCYFNLFLFLAYGYPLNIEGQITKAERLTFLESRKQNWVIKR